MQKVVQAAPKTQRRKELRASDNCLPGFNKKSKQLKRRSRRGGQPLQAYDEMSRVHLNSELLSRGLKLGRNAARRLAANDKAAVDLTHDPRAEAESRSATESRSRAVPADDGVLMNDDFGDIRAVADAHECLSVHSRTCSRATQHFMRTGVGVRASWVEIARFRLHGETAAVLPESVWKTWKLHARPFQLEWTQDNCWLAATFQALLSSPTFRRQWADVATVRRYMTTSGNDARSCLAGAVCELVTACSDAATDCGNGAAMARFYYKVFREPTRTRFLKGRQNDAQDAVVWLLG